MLEQVEELAQDLVMALADGEEVPREVTSRAHREGALHGGLSEEVSGQGAPLGREHHSQPLLHMGQLLVPMAGQHSRDVHTLDVVSGQGDEALSAGILDEEPK